MKKIKNLKKRYIRGIRMKDIEKLNRKLQYESDSLEYRKKKLAALEAGNTVSNKQKIIANLKTKISMIEGRIQVLEENIDKTTKEPEIT